MHVFGHLHTAHSIILNTLLTASSITPGYISPRLEIRQPSGSSGAYLGARFCSTRSGSIRSGLVTLPRGGSTIYPGTDCTP